ncbi:hypothetical protein SUGI_0459450 [Cryptomeria japonica]|nr:hypothetical protein SUGI_0459450 [Cryptomeria japonica]
MARSKGNPQVLLVKQIIRAFCRFVKAHKAIGYDLVPKSRRALLEKSEEDGRLKLIAISALISLGLEFHFIKSTWIFKSLQQWEFRQAREASSNRKEAIMLSVVVQDLFEQGFIGPGHGACNSGHCLIEAT